MIQGFVWKEKIYSKHLPSFGEKTRWSDKIRPRASGVGRSEKKIHEKLDKISRYLEKNIIEKFQVKVPKMKIQKSAQTKFSTEWESHVLILLVVHVLNKWLIIKSCHMLQDKNKIVDIIWTSVMYY